VKTKEEGPIKLTFTKEVPIWKSKDKKTFALINAIISEEVSTQIVLVTYSYGVLKK